MNSEKGNGVGNGDLGDLVRRHIRFSLGRRPKHTTKAEFYRAVALSVRDLLVERALDTAERYDRAGAKRLAYLSMEFLMGRALGNALHNLGIHAPAARILKEEFGADLDEVEAQEFDAALGNGGLGRLAACFLDSLATLDMPGFGFGIHYEYGLFRQTILDGRQHEMPDHWLAGETPWLIQRDCDALTIPVYGRVCDERDRDGNYLPMWADWKTLVGVPHDLPIPGYGGRTVNLLRLYSAKASHEFDMEVFNRGGYLEAVQQAVVSETVSKVLYPSDAVESGRELRLVQEYFLVACSLRDIMRHFGATCTDLNDLPSRVAIQLNDTHPALTVAELMRILVDENDLPWEKAWDITQGVCGYTNHTLLPEALEKWPVTLFEKVLPRHLQIIYEVNRRFLDEVGRIWPDDPNRKSRMSLIEEGPVRQVRMANLAVIGSHSVNGVAALHTRLLKENVLRDFHDMYPERFNSKTNGVTQRRFLLKANPGLAGLITRAIGDRWIGDLDQLRGLEKFATDESFLREFMAVKRAAKEKLAAIVKRDAGVTVDPSALFGTQAKRIHEYKRQLLSVLHVMHRYLGILRGAPPPAVPRVFLFAGKAAPGYWAAKEIIHLVHCVAREVNSDPRASAHMRVAFIPDYRVTLAERIFPGTDLSEQISTAGMEASGTGNMKFALNGALTICTLDGANIELMEEVGADNIFLFGLTADEIHAHQRGRTYDPWACYRASEAVRLVMDSIAEDRWSPGRPGLFRWVYDSLLNGGDRYFHLADLDAYLAAQDRVDALYRDPLAWANKAVLNVARSGKFSSDRTIREYARDIWNLEPVAE